MSKIPSAMSLEEVGFTFSKKESHIGAVLDALTFQLNYSQVIGIAGKNGAGKSTLLNIIRGELVPQQGRVLVGNSIVSQNGQRIRIPSVSLVSQRPDASLLPSMTVYENFMIASRTNTFDFRVAYTKGSEKDCIALLSRAGMGLEAKVHEQVRFLSGGQQQALSILIALKSPERVLLMDEPTASLDPVSSVALFELATREARISQALVVIVSHRLNDLIDYCDRVLVIKDGKLALDIERDNHEWNEESLLRHIITK